MGYRTYFGIINKDILNEIRACNTEEELCKVYMKYKWYTEEDIKTEINNNIHYYFPVYKIEYNAEYEFGKDDMKESFSNKPTMIFPDEHPLHKYFIENDFWFGGEELFLAAIEEIRRKIRDYYNNLLYDKDDSMELFEYLDKTTLTPSKKEKWAYDRLAFEIRQKAYEWSDEKCVENMLTPYNLNKNTDNVVNSWLYEYQIFELVRMYKTFNPEKEAVVYFGW